MPLSCTACEVFISTATRNAATACASEVGQGLLRCAEAFASRDYRGRPVDNLGQWHQGVAMQRTCRWEPWRGTTALATETAVAECTGQPEKQLHRIYENYHVGLPDSRQKTCAAQPVRQCKQRRISAMRPAHNSLPAAAPASDDSMPLRFTQRTATAAQPGSPAASAAASTPVPREVVDTTTTGPTVEQPGQSTTLQRLCADYHITAFQRPFYLLMVMKLLPVERG